MYFGLIRPVQEQLNIHLIHPMFDDVLKDNRDLIIKSIQDDITIESKKDLFIDVRVSIPFGAYYFLVLFTLFGSERKSLMRWMHAYNLVLFIISSLLVWLLLSGSYWVAPVINAHEIAYKALFLSLGMILFVKEMKSVPLGTSIFSSPHMG
jgi:hypothetical protein